MIPVLNKVIPFGVSVFKYTVASYLRHSNALSKAQSWQIVEKDVLKKIGSIAQHKSLL